MLLYCAFIIEHQIDSDLNVTLRVSYVTSHAEITVDRTTGLLRELRIHLYPPSNSPGI